MRRFSSIVLVSLLAGAVGISGCSGSSKDKSSSVNGLPSSTQGWATIISSAGKTISNPAYSGGVTNGQTSGPFSLFFLDSNHAFTAGHLGEILETSNGGNSAGGLPSTPTAGDIYAIAALSTSEIWVAGKDTTNGGASIWKTTDGGSHWSLEVNTITIFSEGTSYLDRIEAFVITSSRQVAAVGGMTSGSQGFVLGRTSSGSWSALLQTADTDRFYGIEAVSGNANTLVITGDGGVIRTTSDMGAHWSNVASGTLNSLYKVKCQLTTCYAVGDSGTILKTTNGGAHWSSLNSGAHAQLASVAIGPSGGVWSGGLGGVSSSFITHSPDGGSTWTQQTTDASCGIMDLVMVSDTVGWAACANTASNTGALLYTSSGGN